MKSPHVGMLMLAGIVLPCLLFVDLSIASENNEYDVAKIPPALAKDADAVIRAKIVRFEIKNRKRSKETVKRAVTIFNKEGRSHGKIFLDYNKFLEIDQLEGKIFNAQGEMIRELEDKDIDDLSTRSGYEFFDDDKEKRAELYYNEYPYTVEYSYVISYAGSLHWPVWQSQSTRDPVEYSKFEVVSALEDSLRYWCSSDTLKPSITIEGDQRILVWEAKNLPKLSRDVASDDVEDYATIVRIAPCLFEFGGYTGDMRTWKDFGIWDYSLLQGRDKIPASAVNDIHSLLLPSDNVRMKIKKLYRYMQDRTRYVSIQLGIGGWQPLDATFVHENGYGDCKALSNYMVALLKEAGITAYSTDILAGSFRLPFIEEFPSAHFNHVIVCVPQEQDTIWLECTDSSSPFGHLGSFTENRGALMITPEGGIVVHTPPTSAQQNIQKRIASVSLSARGQAEVTTTLQNSNDRQDILSAAFHDTSPQDQERWIQRNIGIQNVSLKNFSIDGIQDHSLRLTLIMNLTLPRFASASGDRIFFMPNLMERQTYIPPDVGHRLSPIRYSFPYMDIDSISYSLPKEYTIESSPAKTDLQSSFGEFHSQTIVRGDTAILYIRSQEIRTYSIPAQNYAEYKKFLSDIVKADKAQVVLVRKNR